jgi:TolB-like protein
MRRLYVTVLIVLIFFASNFKLSLAYEKEIKSLSSTMAENIAKAGKKSIAVVDFTDLQGNVTELGRFISEEFSVALTGAGKGFEVVDRTHLKTILKEHKLAITGIIDPTTAKKLGQVAGVDALVTGTITPFGDSVRLSVKILDTATATVIGASSGDIPKTKAIEELLGKGIESGITTEKATASATPSPSKPKTLSRVEVKDFIFEAKECKVSGQNVTCNISVINDDQRTRHFKLYLRDGFGDPTMSLMVDDSGKQYPPAAGWFGAIGGSGKWWIEQNVPPNLPMNLTLIYKGVETKAKYVNIVVDFVSYELLKAVLRNIPLTK